MVNSVYDALKERLATIERRAAMEDARHASAIEEIAASRKIVLRQIELEQEFGNSENAHPARSTTIEPLRPGATNALENEILALVSDRRSWPHNSIKAELVKRGFGPNDPQFGRALQGVLLAIRKRGWLTLDSDIGELPSPREEKAPSALTERAT